MGDLAVAGSASTDQPKLPLKNASTVLNHTKACDAGLGSKSLSLKPVTPIRKFGNSNQGSSLVSKLLEYQGTPEGAPGRLGLSLRESGRRWRGLVKILLRGLGLRVARSSVLAVEAFE